jgi:hypothetical protein
MRSMTELAIVRGGCVLWCRKRWVRMTGLTQIIAIGQKQLVVLATVGLMTPRAIAIQQRLMDIHLSVSRMWLVTLTAQVPFTLDQ